MSPVSVSPPLPHSLAFIPVILPVHLLSGQQQSVKSSGQHSVFIFLTFSEPFDSSRSFFYSWKLFFLNLASGILLCWFSFCFSDCPLLSLLCWILLPPPSLKVSMSQDPVLYPGKSFCRCFHLMPSLSGLSDSWLRFLSLACTSPWNQTCIS